MASQVFVGATGKRLMVEAGLAGRKGLKESGLGHVGVQRRRSRSMTTHFGVSAQLVRENS